MSKTFDNIAEASSTNYLFLKAQMTISLAQEPPTPPPLYALSFPSELLCAALWSVKRLAPKDSCLQEWATKPSCFERWAAKTDPPVEAVAMDWRAQRNRAMGTGGNRSIGRVPAEERDKDTGPPALARTSTSSDLALHRMTEEERIGPLAKAVTKYVLDHQADVAQEERWRTSMQRKMEKHFQEMKANQAQMKANQDQMMEANQGQMNQNFKDLRAELENTKKQMNADNMEQILSALRGFSAA